MQRIVKKYRLVGLQDPSFLFIEVPKFDHYTKSASGKVYNMSILEHRVRLMLEFADRHSNQAMYHSFLARFYGIPYISLGDVVHPAFVRYLFDMKDHMEFPLTDYHLRFEGIDLLFSSVVFPFVKEVMLPRDTDSRVNKSEPLNPNGLFGYKNLHLFQDKESANVMRSWMFPSSFSNYNYTDVIVQSPGWNIANYKQTKDDHKCYMSTSKGSTAVFRIQMPSYCGKESNCQVKISYLRSWNANGIPVKRHNHML